MDKDNESYLDGLLEAAGQEPPYETDRRKKATARAKSGKSRVPSKEVSVDSLEEEFDLDDLDDSFLDDIDLDGIMESEKEQAAESEAAAEPMLESEPSADPMPEPEQASLEIGEELGAGLDEEQGEISFDEAGSSLEEEPLPVIEPLEDLGLPEIRLEEGQKEKQEKKNKKAGKKKPDNKKSGKKGVFSAIFHKLFANIPLTDEELAAIPTPEEEAAAKKEKEEIAAKTKEEKKAKADADKKKKAEDAKKKAADNKAKKAAKEAAKKAAKKEAELKRLRAEALEGPEGKINKAGAGIVFLFFIVVAAVIIAGTNIFSYDISIADATYKFGNHKYTEAYEGIRGLDIKEKDMELHDKIYTVMFVNKQLNSYNNFFAMGNYSAALDSLIKGLSRYDKYIALARQLGIHTDLDYVRKQIMSELMSTYGISEREALELMGMEDRQEYSERIYSIVSKLDTKAFEKEKEVKELVP